MSWIKSATVLDPLDSEQWLEDFAFSCIEAMGMEKSARLCARLDIKAVVPEPLGRASAASDPGRHFYMWPDLSSQGLSDSWGALARLRGEGLAQHFMLHGSTVEMYKVEAEALEKEPELFKSGGFLFYSNLGEAKAGRERPLEEVCRASGCMEEYASMERKLAAGLAAMQQSNSQGRR